MERPSILRRIGKPLAKAAALLAADAPGWVHAAETVPASTAPGLDEIGRLVLTLLAVIAVFVFLTWLLRRIGGNFGSFNSGPLKVKAGISVGPRERLVVVQIGNTHLLLGITAESITRLHELGADESAQFEAQRAGEFSTRFRKALGDKDKS